MESHYIEGEWREGKGEVFSSQSPATGEEVWRGKEATDQEIEEAVLAARKSFPAWSRFSFDERVAYLLAFEQNLKTHQEDFSLIISKETGKPLWESKTELSSMIQKIELSIQAFKERCPDKNFPLGAVSLLLHHKPYGVVAVFGPFNFPGHLPNGHIVPALLSGNTVVFKGSELTPGVSAMLVHCLESLPKGVINLIQGGASVGRLLASHQQIDGLFFTGSYGTGSALSDIFKKSPEKILALEMGGNNPLVISTIADRRAAAYLTLHSAFLTAGQRCTCARRLIVLEGNDAFLKELIQMASQIRVGPYTMRPEPFMGPVISEKSAEKLISAQNKLKNQGGLPLLEMRKIVENRPFLSPGIMDVTHIPHRRDEELFGPFLQVVRVPSFEAALVEANNTHYGLVASIFTDEPAQFKRFYEEIRAGVINWNTPTTGASGKVPFGGVGKSGNHHPSGYYAVDYCTYPVSSLQSEAIHVPKILTPGIPL